MKTFYVGLSGYPVGGFMVFEDPMCRTALRTPRLAYGEMPPRFRTEEKAEAYGRKVLREIAKAAK